LDADDADCRLVPALAEALHLPDAGPGRRLASRPVFEPEFEDLQRAEDTLLPPAAGPRRQDRPDLEAAPQGGKPAVHHFERLTTAALQHQGGGARQVALAFEERLGRAVAVEQAGGVAAAVQAEVERVQRPRAARVQLFRPAFQQVRLAPPQQLGADAPAAV